MTHIAFAPVIPWWLLATLGGVAALVIVYAALTRARGVWGRALAFAILLFALADPMLVKEKHAPLSDVAVVVTDHSQSMQVGDREPQAASAQRRIHQMLASQPGLVVRQTSITTTTNGQNNGTRAFAAINAAIADVPPDRLAGVILITDGQVHDTPPSNHLPFKAPLQILIAGKQNEQDRKLTVADAARYAIVDQKAQIRLKVDDLGAATQEGQARVSLRIGGKPFETLSVPLGKLATISVPITHEGENLVEISASPGPHELTLENNRAVVTISGVRDRLRVLLVSGEPYAGERVWRNLLKADPSVDLIHFTILRPPDKQDATPLSELSLIAFPTRELFSEKLRSFDLIIFDRYRERGILPLAYFQNIANYVEDGGALLVASGPEFAGPESVWRTPLSAVLPAQPTGKVFTGGFKPRITTAGEAQPVTADLPGQGENGNPPGWGRWFRIIGANKIAGHTVMAGPDDRPLLVLDQVGKGRVAELLSDQIWLWARGFEGGGPQAELLRRLAHWLMKEPELEAESLNADITDGTITITRHTMGESAAPVTLTLPSGKTTTLTLKKTRPGIWQASARAEQMGLYRADDGTLSTVAAAGPLNPREVADVRATDAILAPAAQASGGSVHWLADGTPDIRRVAPGEGASGSDWIGVRANGAYRVTALEQQKLLPQWLALLLILGTLLLAWRLESR